jgi:sulfopyruvate decarboxylase subunit alpha
MNRHAQDFWAALRARGMTFASGVPCSYLRSLVAAAEADPEVRYVPAVREDVALGVASAASLAGPPGVALMQNSGLGNVVNALTSFNLIYRIPVLMVISWRGEQGRDAPEHLVMGAKMLPMLDLLEIPYQVLTTGPVEPVVERAVEAMEAGTPAAIVVPGGFME